MRTYPQRARDILARAERARTLTAAEGAAIDIEALADEAWEAANDARSEYERLQLAWERTVRVGNMAQQLADDLG
jgi:hypothetical protein